MIASGSHKTIGKKIWFVCPSYFDTESWAVLRRELTRVLHSMRESQLIAHFVLIDDTAGQDRAVDAVTLDDQTFIVRPPYNLGHQGAIVYALRESSEKFDDDDIVITLDADGEDRPSDIPALIEALAGLGPSGVVLARRRKRQESRKFQIGYHFFRFLFLVLTGKSIRTGNFAAQRGGFIKSAIWNPSFDKCYSTSLVAMRRERAFVTTDRGERYAGESRMKFIGLAGHGLRMMLPFSDLIAIRMTLLSLLFVVTGVLGLSFSVVRGRWQDGPQFVLILATGLVILTSALSLFQSFFQVSVQPGFTRFQQGSRR